MCITKNLPLEPTPTSQTPSFQKPNSGQGSSKQEGVWLPEINVGVEGKPTVELNQDAKSTSSQGQDKRPQVKWRRWEKGEFEKSSRSRLPVA